MLSPTQAEREERSRVIAAIAAAVNANETIRLPSRLNNSEQTFAGEVGGFHYQFEGEDDLLHLAVTRLSGGSLTAEDGQAVAAFLLEGIPPGLVWIRPGEISQHFYLGHDDLVAHVRS